MYGQVLYYISMVKQETTEGRKMDTNTNMSPRLIHIQDETTRRKLQHLRYSCWLEAKINGQVELDGGATNCESYAPTEADCIWIVGELGFKPTREEWLSVDGIGWVGSDHCSN